ncbi:MAG: HD domain-containing protein, partial [Chloroflexota bacterium]
IENLADIAIEAFEQRRRQRDDVLTYAKLKKVVDLLCKLPLDERRKVPGINPHRADIIIAGAAIIETLMHDLEIETLRISDRGLRDGLLMDYLSRSEYAGVLEGESVRERSVLQLGRLCNFDEPHSREVARLALELFDSAREIGLHTFGNWERELLHYAALLHDVGIFLSYNNHHQHSYYLIRNTELLGFDENETSIMAATALFHRKAMPRKKKHPAFAALDKPSQRRVRVFALLLRLAESLDRGHAGVVRHAALRSGANGQVSLEIQASRDCQLELWAAQTHDGFFEKVFAREMVVKAEITPAENPY